MKNTLKFRVCTYTYTLRIESTPIIHNERQCRALAEATDRSIRMAADLPGEERMNVLLHELRRCWGFHIPRPRTEEEEADLMAMIAETAYEDLKAQGGEIVLQNLQPSDQDSTPVMVGTQPTPIEVTRLQRLRALAEMSGKWAGESPPQWCGQAGSWFDMWVETDADFPVAARAQVMRNDIDTVFTGIAYRREHPDAQPTTLVKLAAIEAYLTAFPMILELARD